MNQNALDDSHLEIIYILGMMRSRIQLQRDYFPRGLRHSQVNGTEEMAEGKSISKKRAGGGTTGKRGLPRNLGAII